MSPHYAVLNINSPTILEEPWAVYTALLVFPGGADLQYCREFNGKGNQLITQYVRRGGRYIGFCAGAYYGSGRVEFEVGNKDLEVSGGRELKFFPGTARGAVFKGFEYGNQAHARAANVKVLKNSLGISDPEFPDELAVYNNGGCLFVDAEKYKNKGVEVLARYTDTLKVEGSDIGTDGVDSKEPAAAIYCKVGNGSVILTGVHPEFSPDLLKRIPNNEEYAATLRKLIDAQSHGLVFMRGLLMKLGLKVDQSAVPIPGLSRLSLTATVSDKVAPLIEVLKKEIGVEGTNLLKGHNDTFRIWDACGEVFKPNSESPPKEEKEDGEQDLHPDLDKVIKDVDVYYDGLPDNRITSSFDHQLYYESLNKCYEENNSNSPREFGSFLLYGDVVTSTSTMLYKNFNLLRVLPTGFSTVGFVQVAGRGRGNNVWVSPPGVLATSTVLRMPLQDDRGLPFPMVFTQYIASLAIVEAIRNYGPGYDSIPVRLKWPNDMYVLNPNFKAGEAQDSTADDEAAEPEFYKVGGVLINSTILDKEYVLVVGLGVNVSNHAPSISLNTIVNKLNDGVRKTKGLPPLEHFTIEALLAKYFALLDSMLITFKYQGFAAFEDLYYKRWLHDNKIVTLEQYHNVKARIKGISKDFGMLVVEEVNRENKPTGKSYELQPDGNSFDMMKGLLKKKT